MDSKLEIDDTSCRERETAHASELQKLSSDPTITKHPDPEFCFRFRNPDELDEEEPVPFVVNYSVPPRSANATRTDWRLRRSPKE
jgi:hypothetical protein